jgi:putative hemolysin
MIPNWLFFFLSTFLAVFIQAIFALFEMGSVSFNKVRLQYYVSIGKKRALWLNFLLKRPARLFGTTLIGINTALQIGSECSRRFYESIHLNPDWAPLTQVLIVVVFGELAPLFAARRHPEQVAMFLAPFMMVMARIFTPLIWTFGLISNGIHYLMGRKKEVPLFLSREEVKLAFEDAEEKTSELTKVVGHIFQLKNQIAKELMTPLSRIQMVSSVAHLSQARHHLSVHYESFVPIYHKSPSNVVAMAHLSDLLKCDPHTPIIKYARSPWFVTENSSILDILDQFRRNNQIVAVILDKSGQTSGLLTLDQILSQIFGKEEVKEKQETIPSLHIERTLLGEMKVKEFNQQFQADIVCLDGDTLSDWILTQLDHAPAKGETFRFESFVFTILEPSLRGIKLLSVRSI